MTKSNSKLYRKFMERIGTKPVEQFTDLERKTMAMISQDPKHRHLLDEWISNQPALAKDTHTIDGITFSHKPQLTTNGEYKQHDTLISFDVPVIDVPNHVRDTAVEIATNSHKAQNPAARKPNGIDVSEHYDGDDGNSYIRLRTHEPNKT